MVKLEDIIDQWFMDHGWEKWDDWGFCIDTLHGRKLFARKEDDSLVIGTILVQDHADASGWWSGLEIFTDFCNPNVFDKMERAANIAIQELYKCYGKPNV